MKQILKNQSCKYHNFWFFVLALLKIIPLFILQYCLKFCKCIYPTVYLEEYQQEWKYLDVRMK